MMPSSRRTLSSTDRRLKALLAAQLFLADGSWLDLLASFDRVEAGPGWTLPARDADEETVTDYWADDWAAVREQAWRSAVHSSSTELEERARYNVRVWGHSPRQYDRQFEILDRWAQTVLPRSGRL